MVDYCKIKKKENMYGIPFSVGLLQLKLAFFFLKKLPFF